MSSAIEVLKRLKHHVDFAENIGDDYIQDSTIQTSDLKEAIVALEQKEKLKVWLERNIKKDVEMGSFTDWWTDGHITALKEVLELMK